MAEEGKTGPGDTLKDQPSDALAASGGTSKTDSGDVKSQPKGKADSGTTGADRDKGPQKTVDDDGPAFFDPKDLDPALMPAYKNMQRDYKRKMDEIAKNRQKVEAYDNFGRNPVGAMQTMAQRLGYRLTRAEAQDAIKNQEGGIPQDWEPKTWNEVIEKVSGLVEQGASKKMMERLGPIINEVQTLRKSNLEKFLDDNCSDWRTYEDDMKANLEAHPTLVHDPAKLYRMSVPPEVLETQAFQKAMKKIESKVKGSEVGGKGSTSSKGGDSGIPDKPVSFQDAVEIAKRKLAADGLHPPKS